MKNQQIVEMIEKILKKYGYEENRPFGEVAKALLPLIKKLAVEIKLDRTKIAEIISETRGYSNYTIFEIADKIIQSNPLKLKDK